MTYYVFGGMLNLAQSIHNQQWNVLYIFVFLLCLKFHIIFMPRMQCSADVLLCYNVSISSHVQPIFMTSALEVFYYIMRYI